MVPAWMPPNVPAARLAIVEVLTELPALARVGAIATEGFNLPATLASDQSLDVARAAALEQRVVTEDVVDGGYRIVLTAWTPGWPQQPPAPVVSASAARSDAADACLSDESCPTTS